MIIIDVFYVLPPRVEKLTSKPKCRESKEQGFQIEKIGGGFSVICGSPGSQPPEVLEIRVAYDVRRGTPLKRYKPADFRLDRAPIRAAAVSEITVRECAENRLVVESGGPNFRLEVSGFDPERDLFVDAKPKEKSDASGGAATDERGV